jgi:[acyl-carrier-protein] S-malonyltransferase
VTTAWLFAGQGAEEPRMGLALAARSPAARALLECASRHVNLDVPRLLARGGAQLERTEILQPISIAVSLGAALALVAGGATPDLVAGHSLGELAAWSAAGALAPEDAIALAAARGRLMAEAAIASPGGMLALGGTTEAEVERALARGRAHGWIVLASQNAPDEWVLSGEESALRAVESSTPCARLRVAGPWHSPAMHAAATRLEELASSVPVSSLAVPLVAGADGDLAVDARQLAARLGEQLERPLRWVAVMQTLRDRGVTRVVTCGPGKVLGSLVRRNLGPAVRVLGTDDPPAIERALAESLA